MNAKKITSLVLAAVMAAGTTVTAFAEIDVSNPGKGLDADRPLAFEDENVYVDRDGILVKNPDEYRPGDTIYIRLTEYWADKAKGEKDSKIEDEKERMNVYADWKVGKDAVEDMDIVYDKGFYEDSYNFAGYQYGVTVTGKVGDYFPANMDSFFVAGKKLDTDAEVKAKFADSEFMDKAVDYAKKTSGYTLGSKYYADAESVLEAGGLTKGVWYKGDQTYPSGADYDVVTALSSGAQSGTGASWFVSPEVYAAGFGEMTQTPGAGYINVSGSSYIPSSEASEGFYYIDTTKIATVDDLYEAGYDKLTKCGYCDLTAGIAYTEDEGIVHVGATKITANPVWVTDVTSNAFVTKEADARTAILAEVTLNAASGASTGADTGYTYWVKIDTVEDDTTKVVDLAGILYVGRTRNKAEDADNAFHLDAPLSNRVNDSTNYVTVDDEYTFKPDSRSVVKFDKDADDVVLYFGENEDAWFAVDARGQSALNLEFTFDFNREIADLFPKANIDFLTFTSEPSFNRTGTLYIVADADSFIYEVTENGVKEIANAEYDEDEEAWVIRTRKLAAYAISDRELDTSITLDGEDNTTSVDADGNKQNPDTGR